MPVLKIKKELKAALIALFSIGFFILLVNYIKGKKFFEKGIVLYATYKDVHGLRIASPVVINGFKVGKVEEVFFDPNHSGNLVVKMRIESNLNFSSHSTALISSNSLIEGPEIRLKIALEGPKVKNGDQLRSIEKNFSLSSLMEKGAPMSEDIAEILKKMNIMLSTINSFLDKESIPIAKVIGETNQALGKITQVGNRFDKLIESTQKAMLAYEKIANSINKIKLEKTINNFNNSLQEVEYSLKKINQGKGNLGKLLKEEGLYEEIKGLSREIKLLSKDLRLNPGRYFHFSVFGKKNKAFSSEEK